MQQILSRVRTKEEKETLLEELEVLLSSFYENKGLGFEETCRKKVRFWVSQVLLEELASLEVDKADYLKKLKDEVEKMKTITVNVAFEPTDEIVDRVSDYINLNFGQKLILDINTERDLIGGAVIIYEGKYFDFSVKKVFEKQFIKANDVILNLLKE